MLLKKNKYLVVLVITFLVFLNLKAQQNKVLLQGTVLHDSIYLQNINILNKSSNNGTSSTDKGKFTITAKLGDSILFSSLVYKNRNIKISENHIKHKALIVYLEPGYNQLDEVEINHWFTLNLGDVAVDERMVFQSGELNSKKPPNAVKFTDPTAKHYGISFRGIVRALTKKIRKKRLNSKIELEKLKVLKQEFPSKLRDLYGDKFFTEWLDIPQGEINLFLDFSQNNGLDSLYNSDEIVIKNFLVKQSSIFNSIKN